MNDRDKETISYIFLIAFLCFSLIVFCWVIYQFLPNQEEIIYSNSYNFPPAMD